MVDTSRRAAAEVGIRRVRAYARRANSEDSIEVLSTTESIFPDDLTAITEEEAEHHLLNNGFDDEEEILTERKSEEKMVNAATLVNDDETERPVLEGGGCVDRDESLTPITVRGEGGIKKEQVSECLKINEVYGDKPERTSKLLQGNTSATIFMSKAPFKHDLRH